MNALEFRLFVFKKQNYQYTFFRPATTRLIIDGWDRIKTEVLEEQKIVKVYCTDEDTLRDCFEAAIRVVTYKPLIVDDLNIELNVKTQATMTAPLAKHVSGELHSKIVTVTQMYVLERAILNEIIPSETRVDFNVSFGNHGLIFAEDCLQLSPNDNIVSLNEKSSATLEDIYSIAKLIKSTIMHDIETSQCEIMVRNVSRINGNYSVKFAITFTPNVVLKYPTSISVSSISKDYTQSINNLKLTFADYMKIFGDLTPADKLSASIFIPTALYEKLFGPSSSIDAEIHKGRPMLLSDLENYMLNYIDHMYDDIYETNFTSLENLSYYIL